ncbi:MAG: hypothetical protein R3293_23925 [Candidatus Promineifilaceae bacterium]|nr:hypothetical protein [Candidatus Promineifilaceae bacterium]
MAKSRLCIIGAYRQEEQERIQSVRHMFRRSGLLSEIWLRGLSTEAVHEVLGLSTNDLPDQVVFARRLRQITDGNAFFVLETIRTLLESDSLWRTPKDIPLPQSIQEAIVDRLALLSPLSRQILEAAAVLFPDLDLELLELTAGKTEFETVDSLDELTGRRILKEKADSFEFHHELLRTAVYQLLSPWRRKLLHRRAGNALGAKHVGREEAVAAQMAFHFDSALEYDLAVDFYERAAVAAQAIYAYREALQHVQRAFILLPKAENNPVRSTNLYELLAQSLGHLGRYEEARDALQQAILTSNPEDSYQLAQLHYQIAGTHIAQLNYPEANDGLAESLTHLVNPRAQRNDQWWKLWLDIKLNYLTLSSYHMDVERSQSLIDEIAPVIENSGTENQRRYYANRIFIARMVMERYQPSAETITLTELELDKARESQNPLIMTYAEFYMGFCLFFTNQLAPSEQWLLAALNSAREINLRSMEGRCLAFLSTLYRRQGDLVNTEKYARETEVVGESIGSLHYQAHCLANLAWIAYQKGHRDHVLETAVMACEYFVSSAVPFAWIGYMPLLAITLNLQRLGSAVEAARAMLDPYQQRLPDNLTHALNGAVGSWDRQDEHHTRKSLKQAVDLAKKEGYL